MALCPLGQHLSTVYVSVSQAYVSALFAEQRAYLAYCSAASTLLDARADVIHHMQSGCNNPYTCATLYALNQALSQASSNFWDAEEAWLQAEATRKYLDSARATARNNYETHIEDCDDCS
jgi:hypothetical protein